MIHEHGNRKLPSPDPRVSVFINCPFDEDYEPLLDALAFTAVCCGFHPRTADESGAVDIPRIDRIAHAIFTSCYSIHDLSRYQGEGKDLIARFNMPLELGMVVSRQFVSTTLGRHDLDRRKASGTTKKSSKAQGKRSGQKPDRLANDIQGLAQLHRWLVLLPDDADADKLVSDLRGYDLKSYGGDVESMVPRVMSWFYAMQDGIGGLEPDDVLDGYSAFRSEIVRLRSVWKEALLWRRVIEIAEEFVPTP